MNLLHETFLRRSLILAMLITAAACSKHQTSTPAANVAATGPVIDPGAANRNADAEEILKSEVAAGGIPTTYQASFQDNQLKRIAETRKTDASTPRSGEYEFYGARLTKYTGAPLRGDTRIELEFNLQGAVTRARAGSNQVASDEIDAIRARAQLLRSHALAQRSVRAHDTETNHDH